MRNVDDGNFKENLLLFPRHILPCNKKTFSSRLHRRNRLKCCWQVNPQKGTKSIWMPGQLGRLRQCKSARVIVIGEICNFLASNSWQLPFDSHNSKLRNSASSFHWLSSSIFIEIGICCPCFDRRPEKRETRE